MDPATRKAEEVEAIPVPDVPTHDPSEPGFTYHLRDPANPGVAICGVPVGAPATWQQFSAKPCSCCVRDKMK